MKSSSVAATADRASTTTASPPARAVVLTVAVPPSQKRAQTQNPTTLSSRPAAIPPKKREQEELETRGEMQGKGAMPLEESEPLCAGEGRFLPATPCKESRGGEPLVWSGMVGWLSKAEGERERGQVRWMSCGPAGF
jgi:hypothetical protein